MRDFNRLFKKQKDVSSKGKVEDTSSEKLLSSIFSKYNLFISIIISALVVWFHLTDLGLRHLFPGLLTDVYVLLAIVVSGTIFCTFLFGTVFISFLKLGQEVYKLEIESKSLFYRDLLIYSTIMWLLSIGLMIVISIDNKIYSVILVIVVCIFIFITICFYYRLFQSKKLSFKNNIDFYFIYIMFFFLFFSFILLYFFTIFNSKTFSFFFLFIILSFLSAVIAFVELKFKREISNKIIFTLTGIVVIFIIYIEILYPIIKLKDKVLILSGFTQNQYESRWYSFVLDEKLITQANQYHWQLDKDKLKPFKITPDLLENNKITQQENTQETNSQSDLATRVAIDTKYAEKPNTLFGFFVWNLGDIKVFCAYPKEKKTEIDKDYIEKFCIEVPDGVLTPIPGYIKRK
ncbi:hypothetical protein [Pelistega ratti]|uniref:hypothetical protein n=1 Tax=Pelistega ratti TaxID=2652177 RepID=UPI00135A04D5|nr:hypothetical protein [Pelistega ratti]